MATVDFFYGLGSRYSYLAATQIAGLAERTGARFVWRPLFSGDLMRRQGRSPFEGPPLSGQYDWTYRRIDAERWADFYGAGFVEPAPFALPPARYALAAEAARDWDAVPDFSRALFGAIFATGSAVDEPEIAAAASAAGLDATALVAAMDRPETAARVETSVEAALAAGAFGVPTFLVDSDLYWGNDRLRILERRLLRDAKKDETL